MFTLILCLCPWCNHSFQQNTKVSIVFLLGLTYNWDILGTEIEEFCWLTALKFEHPTVPKYCIFFVQIVISTWCFNLQAKHIFDKIYMHFVSMHISQHEDNCVCLCENYISRLYRVSSFLIASECRASLDTWPEFGKTENKWNTEFSHLDSSLRSRFLLPMDQLFHPHPEQREGHQVWTELTT